MTDLCEHLASSYEVHVICGQPNSPTDDSYVRAGAAVRSGVTIHRLTHARFTKRAAAGRLINLASFSRASSVYMRRTRLSADIVISETDPFLLPIVAANHARRTGAKLICYLQDIYPDVAEAIGAVKPGLLTRQIRARLRKVYRAADRVVVLGECMRQRLQSPPWSLDTQRMRVIPNWADCESIQPLPSSKNPFRDRERLEDKFVVMHSGNMGLTQRLDVLLSATSEAVWPENAVLLLVGDGAALADLTARARDLPKGRVRFMPYQPRQQLGQSLSAADLHVVSMHENITGCLCPSKLYGILAAGRPVLAIARETTDLCNTVTKYQLGWHCEPGDSQGIAEAVASAASNDAARLAAGERARTIACTNFDRQVVMEQFAEMINELARNPGVSSLASCGKQVSPFN